MASELQGGGFLAGFAAGGIAAFATPGIRALNLGEVGSRIGGTIAAAVAGGVGAQLGGGKFANGALTGAFGYLFNQLSGALTKPGPAPAIGRGVLGGLKLLGSRLLGFLRIAIPTEVDRATFYNHYTSETGYEGISRDGLIRKGVEGIVYLTPDSYASGAEAQSRLALSVTPAGFFRVPSQNVQSIIGQGVVTPSNGQPGGGYEIKVPHAVSIGGALWVPIGP